MVIQQFVSGRRRCGVGTPRAWHRQAHTSSVRPATLPAGSDPMRDHRAALQALRVAIGGMGDSLHSGRICKPLNPPTPGTHIIRRGVVQPIQVKERHAGSVELPTPLEKGIILAVRAAQRATCNGYLQRLVHEWDGELGSVQASETEPLARFVTARLDLSPSLLACA